MELDSSNVDAPKVGTTANPQLNQATPEIQVPGHILRDLIDLMLNEGDMPDNAGNAISSSAPSDYVAASMDIAAEGVSTPTAAVPSSSSTSDSVAAPLGINTVAMPMALQPPVPVIPTLNIVEVTPEQVPAPR
jgi:hypothetical protein